MAKNKAKAVGIADSAKESVMLRKQRIDSSQSGATLRTRVVSDKTKYDRNLRHKKSLADAGDFPFYEGFVKKYSQPSSNGVPHIHRYPRNCHPGAEGDRIHDFSYLYL